MLRRDNLLAGNIFAIPTYLFLGMALLMIGLGAYQIIVVGVDAASYTGMHACCVHYEGAVTYGTLLTSLLLLLLDANLTRNLDLKK